MKKLSIFLLLGLLLAACVNDDKDEDQPILLTNIVMPAEGTVFNPGDKVTIKARGFRQDDIIMLKSIWPEPASPIGVAYATPLPVITEMTATSLTFLAPGYTREATVTVQLKRSGSGETITLGKFLVTDGRAPKEPELYGIINNKGGVMGVTYAVERIDLETGMPKNVVNLENASFSRVMGTRADWEWGLFGVQTVDGISSIYRLDLSMRYWERISDGSIITLGALYGAATAVYKKDENTLHIAEFSTSRAYLKRIDYTLPKGMKPEAFSHYPCISIDDNYLMLSADNGDGSFSPVTLDLAESDGGSANVGSAIWAEKLIPFWIFQKDAETNAHKHAGGYAVVLPNNGGTELRLLDTATMTLKEPFATFPESARSIATHDEGIYTPRFFVLFDAERGRKIKEYDMKTGEWKLLSDMEYAYEEIVATD